MDFSAVVDRLRKHTVQRRRSKRGPLVVVTWDHSHAYFLVVARRGDLLRAVQRGSFQRAPDQELLSQLAGELQQLEVVAHRLLLLLPRAELEMVPFEVPSADDNELPALVQMEIEQQVGESDRQVVVDFLWPRAIATNGQVAEPSSAQAPTALSGGEEESNESGPGESPRADSGLGDSGREEPPGDAGDSADEAASIRGVAYWMFQDTLESWRQRADEAGFQLESAGPRQLGPLAVLRSQRLLGAPLTVAITCYAAEIECMFLRGSEVAALRSLRVGNSDPETLARQVETEIRRTVTLAGWETGQQPPSLILLARGDAGPFGGELAQERLATALSAELIGAHAPVQSDTVNEDPVLWGAGQEYLMGQLAVDLLSPKRSPVPPNPLYRQLAIGGLATVAVAVVAYFLLADVRELRNQVTQQREQVAEAEMLAAKFQEKGDETRYVEQWLGDQVDWLDQLQQLSEQFPEGQVANARRLSAVAIPGGGRFDLSLQVKDPDAVATLEARLRSAGFSVSSGQINERTRATEYPWQFDARIGFQQPADETLDLEEAFLVGENTALEQENPPAADQDELPASVQEAGS